MSEWQWADIAESAFRLPGERNIYRMSLLSLSLSLSSALVSSAAPGSILYITVYCILLYTVYYCILYITVYCILLYTVYYCIRLESGTGGFRDSASIEYVVLFGYMGSYEPK
jgi:hypothetical protein